MNGPSQSAPLAGIRVLDFTRVLAGPYCTTLMADMGADVIKVESGSGDSTRAWAAADASAIAFHNINRGKRSLVVDLRSAEGRKVARELALKSDVVIENFRPGIMELADLSYASLAADAPSIVYCSISGFGQQGRDAQRGGYDLIAQAASGIMSVTGHPDGRPPVKCGIPVADLSAGMFALAAILASLRAVSQTGEGQYIDISLLDAAVSLTLWETGEYWTSGASPQPTGSAHRLAAPYQAFETQDRSIVIAANTDAQFAKLVAIVECPELLEDPRFTSVADRTAHRDELADLLNAAFVTRPATEWLERCDEAGIPASPIRDIEDVVHDEHLISRDMFGALNHASGVEVPYLSSPIGRQFGSHTGQRVGPEFGEHTREILAHELQKDSSTIDDLVRSGAVRTADDQ